MDHTRHVLTADIDKNLAKTLKGHGDFKKKAKVNHYIEFCNSFKLQFVP